jgi:hypothetical protein
MNFSSFFSIFLCLGIFFAAAHASRIRKNAIDHSDIVLDEKPHSLLSSEESAYTNSSLSSSSFSPTAPLPSNQSQDSSLLNSEVLEIIALLMIALVLIIWLFWITYIAGTATTFKIPL